MSETQKPLAGLKVVELGTLIAGPFCTRIMAEFGAEVIKVEAPDGGDGVPGQHGNSSRDKGIRLVDGVN